MAVDAETRKEIERQARLYAAAKEEVTTRIQENVKVAMEKLMATEKALLDEVEVEFDENPFLRLLANIDSENPPTDAEVKSALAKGVPKDFGPSEESFLSLCREIEAFKSWREKAVPVPSNVRATSTTRDTITVTWDTVEGASSYQIEVDGGKSLEGATKNTFTKRGLPPDTEHSLRVRAVRGSTVSGWSDVVKGRTQKGLRYGGVWKECPGNVDENRKCSVDKGNTRIATFINGDSDWCTIIGNTPVPLNTVTSWSIRILESCGNGGSIYIGVAPTNINQNTCNYDKCGWYIHCWNSRLCSGPPHNYSYPQNSKVCKFVFSRPFSEKSGFKK